MGVTTSTTITTSSIAATISATITTTTTTTFTTSAITISITTSITTYISLRQRLPTCGPPCCLKWPVLRSMCIQAKVNVLVFFIRKSLQ